MSKIAPRAQGLQRAGDDTPPHQLTSAAWHLWQMGAGGRGMVELAPRMYGSDDWHLVGTIFHECGHAAVARGLLGEPAWIKILASARGVCYRAGDRYQSPHAVRMFALAGSVAEYLAKYGLAPKYSLNGVPDQELGSWVHPQAMSDSDRINAGAFTASDVLTCAGLVRRCWNDITAESAQVLARELARWGAASC